MHRRTVPFRLYIENLHRPAENPGLGTGVYIRRSLSELYEINLLNKKGLMPKVKGNDCKLAQFVNNISLNMKLVCLQNISESFLWHP